MLLIVGGIGAALLIGGGEDPSGSASDETTAESTADPSGEDAGDDTGKSSANPDDSSTEPSEPEDSPPSTSSEPTSDITSTVGSVDVPGTAPASADARDGSRVTFGAANLTDTDPSTAWRVAGDATGEVLTITFDAEVELRELGMVNGYAKTYPGYDGYTSNRRVLVARWTFDDGSSVDQALRQSRQVQIVPIDTVVTEQVRLELVEVSAPGRGGAGRDYTAISELRFGGVAAD